MQKTKRWKLEDVYYGGKAKFDRAFVKNFEGTKLQMHRLRDRRNWRDSHTWIRDKYTEGLIRKYINKPVEALERAFNQRVKDVKNPYSFKDCYRRIIYNYRTRDWMKCSSYKYIIIDGIIRINPEYAPHKFARYPKFKEHQLKYNKKHIINPGAVRTLPISGEFLGPYSGMKNELPIYLGKLYVIYKGKVHFVDVYHYVKFFTDKELRNPKIAAKKAQYEQDWAEVNIGISWLDCYREERNPRYDRLVKALESPDLSSEIRESYERMLKWTQPTIRHNYGIGHWLHPVCKRKDLE